MKRNEKVIVKKMIVGALSIVIMGTMLAGCGSTKTGSMNDNSKDITVNIGTMDLVNGDLIARKEKFYEDVIGAKVNILTFGSGKDVNTALASKSIDITELGTSPAALGISSGLDYSVIGIGDIIGSAESLVVKKDRNINSVEELRGLKIATPFASTAHYSLLNALKLAGLNATDVQLLDMEADDIYAAWQRDDIDAAYIWYPVLDKLIVEDGVVITGGDKLVNEGVVTGDLFVARNEFSKQHPDIVSKYMQALLMANDVYFNEPEKAYSDIADILGISVEDAKSQSAQFTWLTAEEQLSDDYLGNDMAEILKSTADFLVEQKSITSSPDLEVFKNAIDTSYLEKASENLKKEK